ncbi:hypothetical protein GIB67_015978 [Kingdonia uniflora]|uniref:Ubiquitin-like protease family profile domain-containing protein n=1 Tax=Kingdonia uniflora TaxID=39325 RepID=A0A7J7PCP5_9MAGN|nr:hypothetical protein GIB67_015978 [Kingdonia uniflora]
MKPSKTDIQQGLVQKAMRNQIEAHAIGVVPAIGAPTVGAPAVVLPVVGIPGLGSSSSATEIGAVVVREAVLYYLEILHSLGSTSSLLLRKPRNGSEKEVMRKKMGKGRRQNREPGNKIIKRLKKIKEGKREWQKKLNDSKKNKKVEEPDVLLKKKRRAKFPELGNIQSTAKNILQQVAPGEGLEVVKYLMVDDDVKVNLEVISPKYGGGLLKWKKGDEKDNNDKKYVEEIVKSEEELPQTLEVEKIEDEASQASTDQTTVVSVEEQTIEVVQTDIVISHQKNDVGKASQSKKSKEEVEQNKEEVAEGKDDDDRNSQNKLDPEQARKIFIYDSMVDAKITNVQMKKKKLSLGHQFIEDQISRILPKLSIWRDFADRSSPPTGSEVKDYDLNSKWTYRFGKYPIQPNGHDCGVYMLVFMDNLLRGIKFLDLIDSNQCCYTIAYDILRLGVKPEEI